MINAPVEFGGQVLLGLTDEKSMRDALKIRLRGTQSIRFGAPPDNPINRVEASQRAGRGFAVRRFAVIDELDAVDGGNMFHPMYQAREIKYGASDGFRINAKRARGGIGRGGILPIVPAGQSDRGLQIANRPPAIFEQTTIRRDPVQQPPAGGHRYDIEVISQT